MFCGENALKGVPSTICTVENQPVKFATRPFPHQIYGAKLQEQNMKVGHICTIFAVAMPRHTKN